jgi:hypothetical protein
MEQQRYIIVQHAGYVAIHAAWFDSDNNMVKVNRTEAGLADDSEGYLTKYVSEIHRDLTQHPTVLTTAEFLTATSSVSAV